ncbi:MAG: Sec-independent protein translocase protein TatB [Pseudonocardiaceae bacterium]
MFNIGWAEFLILAVAGLFFFGPDRLPTAAAWLGRTVKQVRDYATGAKEQLRSELGPEFDDLRGPLQDLRGLRDLHPRRAITRSLFDDRSPFDDRSFFDDFDDSSRMKPNGFAAPIGMAKPVERPLQAGERAPFDPDAT